MSKSIKFFSIILIFFSIFISFYGVAHASDIDMNLVADQTSEESISDENATTEDIQNSTDTGTVIPQTGVSATTEEGLGLSNILNILLITVGVVLILLSIAIIIRLK